MQHSELLLTYPIHGATVWAESNTPRWYVMGGWKHVDSHCEFDGHEEVVFASDKTSGLRAIIAVHRTFLNPHSGKPQSLGGIRMVPYATDADALTDVLRLSKGMSYKAALANVPFGGAKSVIIGNPNMLQADKEKLLAAFARVLDKLHGTYVGAEDMGMKVADMDFIRRKTEWVAGTSGHMGGSGDPSRMTALGVFASIEICFERVFGNPSVFGRKVSISGVGNVGRNLAVLLMKNGAHVYIADTNSATLQSVGSLLFDEMQKGQRTGTFTVVEPHECHALDVDAYAPCAGGAILNDDTIPRLRCSVVAGSANNQLAKTHHGDMLHERGILYAPDYVVNAGGLINVSIETEPGGYNEETAQERVRHIPHIVRQIFMRSEAGRIAPHHVADRMALEIIEQKRV